MDLRSASEAFPKITTFMATFLGQPTCPICWLVISFMGLFEKKNVSDTFGRLTKSHTKNF
jgi:hypothetical protein